MRIARRLVRALLIVLVLLVGTAAAAVILAETAWFKDKLRVYIEREANQYLNGRVSIQKLAGNLFYGVELENIDISMDGRQVLGVKNVGLDYNVFEMVSKGLSVAHLRLDHPVVNLQAEGDSWNVSRLIKKQETEADRSGPGKPMSIDEIGITDGLITIDRPQDPAGVQLPKRIERLDAKLSFKYEPVRYSLDIAHLSLRGSDPEIALNELTGKLSVKDDEAFVEKLSIRTAESSLQADGAVQHYLTTPNFKFQINSEKVSLPEIARLVPQLAGVQLQPSFELALDGPLDHLAVDLKTRSAAGQVAGTITADVVAPGQSVVGDLSVRNLNLAPVLNDPAQKSDISADAHVDVSSDTFADLQSLKGTVTLNASHVAAAGYSADRVQAKAKVEGPHVDIEGSAAAYGAAMTTAGRVTLPVTTTTTTKPAARTSALRYDLRGTLRHVDPRKMPRALGIPAADAEVNADYHVTGSGTDVSGTARFEPSTVAGARIAAGSTAAFTMAGKQISYEADATVTDLDLQRMGRQFKVPALDTDRYASTLNIQMTAKGSGTALPLLDVTAAGTITDSTILGGRIPQLAFTGTLAADQAHVTAQGSFADFDPAVASDKPAMKGRVGGSLDVDATVANVSAGVTVDSVVASAKVDLEPSSIGTLKIDRATLDGDYQHSVATVRTLEVVGVGVNVTANGTLALDDEGQSALTVHADSSELDKIGAMIEQPLIGIAKVDATITGNRHLLQADGTLTGNGLGYKDNSALAVSSEFSVKVPELVAADAAVTATTSATFISAAGLQVNELTAKTDYANSQVTFDLTAKQPQRSLAAAGALAIRPDEQEVRLNRLDVQAQNMRWQTEAGAAPVIKYGGNVVDVENLTLVNGTQTISANGRFGKPGDQLMVTLGHIDIPGVEALALRPPQFTGTLDASSTISGTTDAPHVKAEFTVSQGGFREFKYDSFGGSVEYDGKGVTVDTKLQQNPLAWISVQGYAPVAALTTPPRPGQPIVHSTEEVAAADRIDIHVDSSPLDLAVVQGLTTTLTKVKGTVEAHLRVTGSAGDPHPLGTVTVQDGGFTVAPTGAQYTNFRGKIDFQPERIHIDEISVLDNQQSALSISGDLATHEGQVEQVRIYMNAGDFTVVDNQLGSMRIDSNLEIAGELRAPRIEGDLGVSRGSLNLDPILAAIGDSPYATKPVETETAAADEGTPAPPTAFDQLRLNLRLTVPNDLVIKANDLKTPGAPIGLGALNVTLGGDMTATKEPGKELMLVGSVNTVRGFYEFQGRRFEIQRDGTVRFEGSNLLQPTLDIKAQRVIQAVTAMVNVRGTLDKPEIVLTSTPPLEPADILSLIVFNQQINQLGEGQQVSLAQRAGSLATGAVAGEVGKSIEKALNLDEFAINTAPDSGGVAQLTVGQQVGQNLYVKVQQGIGSQSQTNVILEYELTKWLRLQTNVLQGSTAQQQVFQRMQGSGADMLFFFSF